MSLFIRNSEPEYGNKFYNTKGNGGYSSCCKGNSNNKYNKGPIAGLNVLPNCVGFASGAFNETVSIARNDYREHYVLNRNAERFIEIASKQGLRCIRIGNYGPSDNRDYVTISSAENHVPPVGSIMVWRVGSDDYSNGLNGGADGAGHVAYVCKVIDNNNVEICESNWNGHYFVHKTVNRNKGAKNNWGLGTKYTYSGCVLNPEVNDDSVLSCYAPVVTSVIEYQDEYLNNKIDININVQGTKDIVGVTVWYKFGKTAEESSYDIINTKTDVKDFFSDIWSNKDITYTIDDPDTEDCKFISILIRQFNQTTEAINVDSAIFTKELKITSKIPCVNVYTYSGYKQAIPYIFHNGVWRKATPYIYKNKNWIKISNTKK